MSFFQGILRRLTGWPIIKVKHEILCWIDEHDGIASSGDAIRINRRTEDPKAIAQITKWLAEPRGEILLEGGASHG